jgi:putative transcriptional regulator
MLINNLKKMRFEHSDMSQQALAEAVGVTRQTIIAIEKGNYTPSLLLALKIAKFFNLSVDEIFSLQEDPHGEASGK